MRSRSSDHEIAAILPIASEGLPVVLSEQEVHAVLAALDGVPWIMGMLLYRAGLRVMEWRRLRVRDVDFDRGELRVREGKGDKDRGTMLPSAAVSRLRAHLAD